MTEKDVPYILTKDYWTKRDLDLRDGEPLTPVESGFPITSITIDLTTGCNLACEYCFTNLSKGKYKVQNLTLEQGMKTIDWLLLPGTRGNNNRVDVAFWGGEPLIRFDLIKELVSYGERRAKEEGVRIYFNGTTNVTLMTQEKIDYFKEHNIQFLFSIDGRPETHDLHRVFSDGSGSYSAIDKNLDAIFKAWPDSQVRLSYSEDNIDSFFEDVLFLYNRGFKRIAYSPVCEGEWPEEKIEAMRVQWDKIADWWLEKKKAGEDLYIKYMDDSCTRYLQPEGNRAPCGAGRGYVGITTEGAIYPCVKPETLVHTENGMKEIAQIEEGEKVLTHTGEYQSVTKLWEKPYSGSMYKITPWQLNIPIEFTPEHPVYGIKGQECNWWHDRCKPDCTRNKGKCPHRHYENYKLDWIDAKDITNKDFLAYPIDKEVKETPVFDISKTATWAKDINQFTVDKDLMYLFGWYAAEGSAVYGSFKFSLSIDEISIAEQLKEIVLDKFGINGTISNTEANNKCELIICSTALSDWFKDQFGKNCSDKKLPEWIMKASPDLQLFLIKGMFYGDGGNDRGKSAFYSTTSVNLANQMKMLLLRQGVVPGMKEYFPKRHKDSVNREKEYRIYVWNIDDCNKLFSEYWTFNEKLGLKSRKMAWIDKDILYLAIRKVEITQYDGTVHNLEVENDNSYTLESICCHNCHRFHKFNDERPWYKQEVCIGHIDHGILNQEWRMNFVKWDSDRDLPESCKACPSYNRNCTGGCWATNWDLGEGLYDSPKIHCESTIKNLEIGERLLKSDMKNELMKMYGPMERQPKSNNHLPMVQGCQCYNVEDNLFGRKTSNPSDPYSCLCNMATYGTPPKLPVESCTCYNLEDQFVTHWDNEDVECINYTLNGDCGGHECTCKEKDPIQEAIDYIKSSNKLASQMDQLEKSTLLEFMQLIDEM